MEACAPASNSNDLAIGYNPESGSGFFDGLIDDVRIYRRALSDAEISELAGDNDIGDTYLFGWWNFDHLIPTSSIPFKNSDIHDITVSLFPNPASVSTNFEFELKKKHHVNIEIKTILGNKIKSIDWDNPPVGYSLYQFDVRDMDPGLYLLNIQTGQHMITRRFQVIR